MTPHQKSLRQLVDRLNRRTLNGELNWTEPNKEYFMLNCIAALSKFMQIKMESGKIQLRRLYDKEGSAKLSFDDNDII